jgi:hypothetical protein
MAAAFELYRVGDDGSNVWKLFKQGTFVGSFVLESVETSYKEDAMTLKNKFNQSIGEALYNTRCSSQGYGLPLRLWSAL